MIKLIKYRCNLCGFETEDKLECEHHEDRCPHDPILKKCESCKYFDDYDPEYDVNNLPYCRLSDKRYAYYDRDEPCDAHQAKT